MPQRRRNPQRACSCEMDTGMRLADLSLAGLSSLCFVNSMSIPCSSRVCPKVPCVVSRVSSDRVVVVALLGQVPSKGLRAKGIVCSWVLKRDGDKAVRSHLILNDTRGFVRAALYINHPLCTACCVQSLQPLLNRARRIHPVINTRSL